MRTTEETLHDDTTNRQPGFTIEFWRNRPRLTDSRDEALSPGETQPPAEELAAWSPAEGRDRDALPPLALSPQHQLRLGTARYEALCLEHRMAGKGATTRVFTNCLDEFWGDAWELNWARRIALDTMRETPHLAWLVLTRRPEAILDLLQIVLEQAKIEQFATPDGSGRLFVRWLQDWQDGQPPANIWLGTTTEGAEGAEARLRALVKVPAVLRFLSPDLCCPRTLQGGTTHLFRTRPQEPPSQWLAHGPAAEELLATLPELLEAETLPAGGLPGPRGRAPSWQRPRRRDALQQHT